jgi:hypothetical protein
VTLGSEPVTLPTTPDTALPVPEEVFTGSCAVVVLPAVWPARRRTEPTVCASVEDLVATEPASVLEAPAS